GTEITDHVAKQVLHHQHVKVPWLQGELHAQGIDEQLFEFEKRIITCHTPRGLQEQAVALRNNVRLVAKGDAAPALVPRQFKGKADDALRRRARHDAQALDDAGDDVVLESGIEPLGVFADYNKVDILERDLNARQRMHRPHTGIEVESLPQADINRAKAHSDRGRARSLERHAILADQLEGGGGQRVAGSLRSTKACFGWNPIDMRPGSANNLASS